MASQAGATGDVDVNSTTTTAQVPMAAEQKLVLPLSSTSSEIPPDRFGREAKHFTETRVLNREVSLFINIKLLQFRELNTTF
jgi:staphylococcal nuclease domain-containing protein 1